MGVVERNKFETYRKLASLRPIVAKQVLKEAESLGLIDVIWSSDSKKIVDQFRFRDNSKEGVLEGLEGFFLDFNQVTFHELHLRYSGSLLSAGHSFPIRRRCSRSREREVH